MKHKIYIAILTLAFMAFAVQAFGQTAISGDGLIESTTGGFKFPNGTIQTSASTDTLAELACDVDQVAKFDGVNWICSSIETGTGLGGVCTAITSLPSVIDIEGIYCFKGNLQTSMTSGHAIEIRADNVVINLNGWKLDGLGAGLSTEANGIQANQKSNITIRNGTIRGFYKGILLSTSDDEKSTGHLIEGVRLDKNTSSGIRVEGTGNIIRSNHVVSTGGSTVVPFAAGIETYGTGCRVLDNDIIDTMAGAGNGAGVYLNSCSGAVIENNRIENVSTVEGDTLGITMGFSENVIVRANSITNTKYGVNYSNSTGKYMDNLTSNVEQPFTGGTDAGGNN